MQSEMLKRVRALIESYETEIGKIEAEIAELASVAQRLRFLQEQEAFIRRILDETRVIEAQLVQREALTPQKTEEIPQ